MNVRPAASAILFAFTTLSVGCSQSEGDYVKYESMAPSPLDLKQKQKAIEKAAESAGSVVDVGGLVTPVSSASPEGGDTTEISRAVVSSETESIAAPATTQGAESAVIKPSDAPPQSTASVNPGADSKVNANSSASEKGPANSALVVTSAQSGLSGPADNPAIENSATAAAGPITLLIPEKTFRKERGSDALRVTYDDIDLLKVLNMEPVPVDAIDHFPEWLQSLNGKPIRIRGFMYPTFEATGLTSFTLARDNGICCFVRKPKIYDIIAVVLADGVTSDYIEGRPFDVEGTFHIEPQADEKDLYGLYRIENAKVLR